MGSGVRRLMAAGLAAAAAALCLSCSKDNSAGGAPSNNGRKGSRGTKGGVEFADSFERIRIEAESAVKIESDDALPDVGGKVMRVVDDPTASGGKCISVPDKAGTPDPPAGQPPKHARAVYKFKVKTAGKYIFWCRRNWWDQCGDTLYVRFDKEGAPHTEAFLCGSDGGPYKVWKWSEVRDKEEEDNRRRFYLAAGDHTMEILNREDGPRFDVILLTDDPDHVPQGMEE